MIISISDKYKEDLLQHLSYHLMVAKTEDDKLDLINTMKQVEGKYLKTYRDGKRYTYSIATCVKQLLYENPGGLFIYEMEQMILERWKDQIRSTSLYTNIGEVLTNETGRLQFRSVLMYPIDGKITVIYKMKKSESIKRNDNIANVSTHDQVGGEERRSCRVI